MRRIIKKGAHLCTQIVHYSFSIRLFTSLFLSFSSLFFEWNIFGFSFSQDFVAYNLIMQTNMESANADDQSLSFSHCLTANSSPPPPPPFSTHLHTSSHLGSLLLNGTNPTTFTDSCQSLDVSHPMQLPYPAHEAPNNSHFPSSFISDHVNKINQPTAFSLYPLEYMTSFLPPQYSQEAPHYNNNVLENGSYALSLTLNGGGGGGGGDDKRLNDELGGGCSTGVNTMQGNPITPAMTDQMEKRWVFLFFDFDFLFYRRKKINCLEKLLCGGRNSCENEKGTNGKRRRARRQRPFRTFGERSSQFRGVSRFAFTSLYDFISTCYCKGLRMLKLKF